jgi:hypothetical protein
MLYQMWQEQASEYHNELIREGNEARLAKAAKCRQASAESTNSLARFIQNALRFVRHRRIQAHSELSAKSDVWRKIF